MVLLIGEEVVQTSSNTESLVEYIISHSAIKESAKKLRSQPARILKDEKLVFVFQRERATALPDKCQFLGSDEATTCNIVILRSPLTGKASAGHFDGSSAQVGGTRCSLKAMVDTFDEKEKSTGIDVHIAGGFLDGKYSLDICGSLLSEMQKMKDINFRLVTCCVYSLNDTEEIRYGKKVHAPIVRGLAVDMKDGSVFSAEFKDRGPDVALRHARFTGAAHLENVYDTQKDLLEIKEFEYRGYGRRDIDVLLSMPDQQLLSLLSTSPEVEADNFVEDMRSTLKFWKENPNWKKYFNGQVRVYKRSSSIGNSWIRVSDDSTNDL